MTDDDIRILIDRGIAEEEAVKRRKTLLACYKLFLAVVLIAVVILIWA